MPWLNKPNINYKLTYMNLKFDQEQINQFWQQHDRFLKSTLVTEAPNPLTKDFSNLCVSNINTAFELFKSIELHAISTLKEHVNLIKLLQNDITECLKRKGKVYLIGCGASGRLAMLLKRLWQQLPNINRSQVVSVSAGGDISLIKAVEQFEDNGHFGIQQILDQGFDLDKDLLIGLSASGESPFIITPIQYVAENGKYKPYFVFNNSITSILERNPKNIVISNKINAMSLDVGAMVLTGSTRLSATTAMHIAIGLAMMPNNNIETFIDTIYNEINSLALHQLAPITNLEAKIIKQKEFILYQTSDMLLGLSLLADITERSPTFNLPSFENEYNPSIKPCPFYLSLENIKNKSEVWQFLFGNIPYSLNWNNYPTTNRNYIDKFDLSINSLRVLGNYLSQKQHLSRWDSKNNILSITLDNSSINFNLPNCDLIKSLVYKICLNAHSTILFGILGYFDGNMMLSLKPSNFKLIDRAIRYSMFLLNTNHNLNVTYKEVATTTFREINNLDEGQSIVKNVVSAFLKAH